MRREGGKTKDMSVLLYAGAAGSRSALAVHAFVRRGCEQKKWNNMTSGGKMFIISKSYALSAFNSAAKSSNSDSSKVLRSGGRCFCIFLQIFVA